MLRALLLALLALAAPAQALLTDPAGDLTMRVEGQDQPTSDERYAALDLTALEVTESEAGFTFVLSVAAFHPPGELYIVNDGIYSIQFRHEDVTYLVRIQRAIAEQDYTWGDLLKLDDQQATFIDVLDVVADLDAATLTTTVPHDQLLDSKGSQPFPGRFLEDFAVESHLRSSQGFFTVGDVNAGSSLDVWDRMPDAGFGADALPVTIGLRQSGHAALSSPVPIRGSNGEEGTFVFELVAENRGDTADTFAITARGVPGNWNVAIPDALLEIPAGESVRIPVLVGTPFSHQHGAVQKFLVEMQSQTDSGSTGRIELGLRYFTIPQPAGHHNEVWFHSARFGEENQFFVVTDNLFSGNGGQVYFNTLQTDTNDQDVPVKGIAFGYGFHEGPSGLPYELYRWFVFMQPDLQIGLDFDLTKTIEMDMPFQSTTPWPQATVQVQLVHFGYDKVADAWDITVVGEDAVGPLDITSEPQLLHFTMEVVPEADLLPYRERAFLGLFVNMTSLRPATFTGAEAPEIAPGGSMVLPLFEYRDPVDEAFLALEDIRMVADQTVRLVNPGETVLFEVDLEHRGKDAATYNLATIGIRNQWLRLPDGAQVTLDPGATARIRVAVDAPPSAMDGDVVDVVLAAEDAADANRRALVRLVAEVDTDQDHADETLRATPDDAQQDTPLPVAWVPASLAAALLLRRRH